MPVVAAVENAVQYARWAYRVVAVEHLVELVRVIGGNVGERSARNSGSELGIDHATSVAELGSLFLGCGVARALQKFLRLFQTADGGALNPQRAFAPVGCNAVDARELCDTKLIGRTRVA